MGVRLRRGKVGVEGARLEEPGGAEEGKGEAGVVWITGMSVDGRVGGGTEGDDDWSLTVTSLTVSVTVLIGSEEPRSEPLLAPRLGLEVGGLMVVVVVVVEEVVGSEFGCVSCVVVVVVVVVSTRLKMW